MNGRILVIEDDLALLTGMVGVLEKQGYTVFSAPEGERGLSLYKKENPDLILLDIALPDMDGFEVCKSVRKDDPQTLIIMLTGNKQETDKVVGLELGADDYIVKGVGVQEILARIKAALRRKNIKSKSKRSGDPIKFGSVYIDTKTLKGKKAGKEFDVTSRDVILLELFISQKGEVLDRDTLLRAGWGIEYRGTTRTLDQYIVNLRKKIEDDPSNPKHLLTVFGEGYRFESRATSKDRRKSKK